MTGHTEPIIPHPRPRPDARKRAVRAVAAHARNGDDLRELLGMLGLDPAEGKAGYQAEPPAPAGRPAAGSPLPPEKVAQLTSGTGILNGAQRLSSSG